MKTNDIGVIMPKEVPDNKESVDMCDQFCGTCPTFTENSLDEVSPEILFCARGKSQKSKEDIEELNCNCPSCPLFTEYSLEGGYFCIYGVEGKK